MGGLLEKTKSMLSQPKGGKSALKLDAVKWVFIIWNFAENIIVYLEKI